MPRIGPWGAAPEPAPPPPPPEPSQFSCPGCGARLGYQPGETHLVCPFCGADSPIPQAGAAAMDEALRERDFEAALAGAPDAAPVETTQTVRCDACGATVEFDPAEHARTCPFCASPLVADPAPDRHIRPQALLPFAIDDRQARDAIGAWLAGLWFAPSGLKSYARERGGLSGVYAPYWTFDARTETRWSGQRGDVFMQTVRGPNGKPQQVARVRWTRRSGTARRDFDDVLCVGSASLPREDADALGPWDLSHLRPYARDWLAGFRAESYTLDLRAAWTDAREKIEQVVRTDVRHAIGGDQQRIERMDTRVADVTFKHVLLPIWIGAYKYRGRVYRVLINGRSGRVRGGRPWSVWKIALAVVAALAVAALAAWLVSLGRTR
jgi:Zn finger protein HypA/HybF involved in hydrogenase expression